MDEYVPFKGGKGQKSLYGTQYGSVDDSIRAWVKANGCDTKPRIDSLSKSGDALTVTRKTYAGGREGTEVVLVEIEGGGHTWPGTRAPAKILGASALNVSANDLMWEFFEKHPIKSSD